MFADTVSLSHRGRSIIRDLPLIQKRKAVLFFMVSLGTGIRVTKAVLLIGGQGTSLTPLTKYRPTAMVPILNRPLIEHTILRLQEGGMTDIVIAGSRGGYSPFCKNYFMNISTGSSRTLNAASIVTAASVVCT